MTRGRYHHQNANNDPARGHYSPAPHVLVQAVACEDRVGDELHSPERSQQRLRSEREGDEIHHAAEHEQCPPSGSHQQPAPQGL